MARVAGSRDVQFALANLQGGASVREQELERELRAAHTRADEATRLWMLFAMSRGRLPPGQ